MQKDLSKNQFDNPNDLLRGSMSVNSKGHLEIGEVDMVGLANSHEYPIYVIDEKLIRKNMHDYITSLSKHYSNPGEIFYASKALMNIGLCKIVQSEGLGLDVSTDGELYTAIQSGFPMQNVIMHGNNKSAQEIELALKAGVGRIVIDNLDDIMLISSIGKKLEKSAKVLVRIKPGIYANTHSHIATGSNESKFGFIIDNNSAEEAIMMTLNEPNLEFLGIHIHIGSQILDLNDYTKAIDLTTEFMKKLHDKKIIVNELNLGGGLGIKYTSRDKKIEINHFIETVCLHLTKSLKNKNLLLPKLMFEPGRSIVGEAGTTIYKIGSTKTSKNQIFAAVNGGMNDNIRSSLYQAKYHAVIANKMNEAANTDTKIVGKSCESGDVLIEQIFLPTPVRGDILAIFSTGAYNYSMASNYNRIPVPGMALVKSGKVEWIVKPQTLEDIIRNDL
ncbi:MAG UNVERIFIED_CONTAM: diaminopimelate decarboxylase [Rickettsiaceae bacterium]|jgi:diaminopimelate decarboxylase